VQGIGLKGKDIMSSKGFARRMARGLSLFVALMSVGASAWAAEVDEEEVGIGEAPPSFVGYNVKGDRVELGSLVGRPVVLSFWATWCGYCLKELPVLSGIQKAAGPDKISVLAVNTEDRRTYLKVSKALKDLELTMLNDPHGAVQTKYGVKGIPHMLIIDHHGRVKKKYVGYGESMLDSIVHELNVVLTEAGAAQPK
jgi:thiol-disulfide isomerase/thioredoxin